MNQVVVDFKIRLTAVTDTLTHPLSLSLILGIVCSLEYVVGGQVQLTSPVDRGCVLTQLTVEIHIQHWHLPHFTYCQFITAILAALKHNVLHLCNCMSSRSRGSCV